MSARERYWPYVSQAFTGNGTNTDIVTVASTAGFYTKQEVTITDTAGTTPVEAQVLEVLSSTTVRIGKRATQVHFGGPIPDGAGGLTLAQFTVANGARITAHYQQKKIPGADHILAVTYEAEPAVALRVMTVDQQGNYVDASSGGGGMATTVSISGSVSVTFTAATDANYQYARVAAASITAGNAAAGSALTILTSSSAKKMMFVYNTLNQDVSLTIGGTEYFRLETQEGLQIDFQANGIQLATSVAIGVFQNGTPPTDGSIRVTLIA